MVVTNPVPQQDVCPGCGKCRQCGQYVGPSWPQPYYVPSWLTPGWTITSSGTGDDDK